MVTSSSIRAVGTGVVDGAEVGTGSGVGVGTAEIVGRDVGDGIGTAVGAGIGIGVVAVATCRSGRMEHIMPRYDAHRPIEGARERSNDLIAVAEEGRTASPLA